MMLLAQQNRRLQTNCCKISGGNAVAGIYGLGMSARRNQREGNAARLNQAWSEGSIKAGVPNGYVHPGWFVPPITSGSLASINEIQGEGDSSASIAGGKNAECSITGTGDMSGTGALIISMVASITASGTISSAAAVAFLNLAASLSASGDLAGAATALGFAAAAVSGSGTVASTATAKGTLASSITSSGGVLDTSNVGALVWAEILEGEFTAERILRIIAAREAGLSSGGPNAPVYRNLSDTQDQITGTATSVGDRSNITYGD